MSIKMDNIQTKPVELGEGGRPSDVKDTKDRASHVSINTLANEFEVDEEVPVPPVKEKKKKLTKAEKKAIRLKAAIEFKKFEFREELERELAMSKRSAMRGQNEWEAMCREIKIVEMYQELVVWNEKTQRVLEAKDEKIARMLKDLTTSRDMQTRSYNKQVDIMDYIIRGYGALVRGKKSLFEKNCSEMIQDFHMELHAKKTFIKQCRRNLENVMFCSNILLETQLVDEYNIFLDRKDDRVNAEIVQRFAVRDKVVAKMELLQRQVLEFFYSLQGAILDENKGPLFDSLMEKQRIFMVETKKLNEIEFRYTRMINEMQRQILYIDVGLQRTSNDLRLEQNYFLQVRRRIETRIRRDREITIQKVKTLCSASYIEQKKFEKLATYGELLLSITATCRKLESESEKVVAGGEDYGDIITRQEKDDEFFKLKAFNVAKHVDISEEDIQFLMHMMRKFWRRQAIVEMENMLLQEEKRRLKAENDKFVNFIRAMTKADKGDDLTPTIVVTNVIPRVVNTKCPKFRLRKRKK